jgi:hypothetical protein
MAGLQIFRLRAPVPLAPTPGRETLDDYCAGHRWSREQFSAAVAIGHPAAIRVHRVTRDGPVLYLFVAPDSAAEFHRDFARMVAGFTDASAPLVSFTDRGSYVPIEDARRAMNLSKAALQLAIQWFRFPSCREVPVRRADGVREFVPCVISRELDQWIEKVQLLHPAFGRVVTAPRDAA